MIARVNHHLKPILADERRHESDDTVLVGVVQGKHCQQVVAFEVIVVGENLVVSHAGTQQFQQKLHRIPQPSHARLAVTDLRVDGDSVGER